MLVIGFKYLYNLHFLNNRKSEIETMISRMMSMWGILMQQNEICYSTSKIPSMHGLCEHKCCLFVLLLLRHLYLKFYVHCNLIITRSVVA